MPVPKIVDFAPPLVVEEYANCRSTQIPPGTIRSMMVEIRDFLLKVANAINKIIDGDLSVIRFEVLTVEPSNKPEGTLAFADGTVWNPGSGAGLYERRGGTWNKL